VKKPPVKLLLQMTWLEMYKGFYESDYAEETAGFIKEFGTNLFSTQYAGLGG
jgi:hypothetical protein